MLTQKDLNEIKKLIDEKLTEKIKHLPTKDEFYTKMDELMGELKGIREEQSAITRISKLEDTIKS